MRDPRRSKASCSSAAWSRMNATMWLTNNKCAAANPYYSRSEHTSPTRKLGKRPNRADNRLDLVRLLVVSLAGASGQCCLLAHGLAEFSPIVDNDSLPPPSRRDAVLPTTKSDGKRQAPDSKPRRARPSRRSRPTWRGTLCIFLIFSISPFQWPARELLGAKGEEIALLRARLVS